MEGQISLNQYEEQLYSVFKSFDINNEEALDKAAVQELCDALQLEERGAALVDTLFEKSAGRVTFSQFRNGLLAVLGDKTSAEPVPDPPDPPAAGVAVASPSDDDSSGREVAPRFVFGSKKYGRRSRPQQGEPHDERASPRAASTSRLEADERPARPRCRRSASAMDTRPDDAAALDHDRRIDRDQALALCRDLRMDAIDRRLVERVFDDSRATDTTVGEFFERLNATLATTMEESKASAAPRDEDDDGETVAIESIAEAWERSGVRRPRRLLAELGFAGAALRLAELERSLDDELRAFGEPLDERAALLAAALALARRRAAAARTRVESVAAERDKLRVDVVEANRRADLLAQEVDESHARIEAELRASVRRAEARHAEESRRADVEAAAERELAAAERARLEAELARRADAEGRLRAELTELGARLESAEGRVLAAEAQREASERERAQLAERVREAEARAAEAARAEAAAAARAEAAAREAGAQRECAEELGAALEAAREERRAPAAGSPAPDGNLCVELDAALDPDRSREEDPSSAPASKPDERPEEVLDTDDEKQKLTALVKELEASLEAMRGEYDACEEYWTRTLASERARHDADARAADQRLADLVARIGDFERRLRPAPALPPIAEHAALEAQVHQLEAELAAARRAARREARRRSSRPAPAPAPDCAAAAAAAAARALRAEAAAARLAARLAAADLLVKELYVENCAARCRPPPDALFPLFS